MKALLDDGNQHVSAHCNPDLRLHRVLAGAQAFLDVQVLLDPFKKQLHLPAAIARIEFARSANQRRSQLRSYAPVAGLVDIGQRGAFDERAKAHRIQLAHIGRQTRLDIEQALAPSQLRKCHRTPLLGVGGCVQVGVAGVAMHDAREDRPRHEFHDLCERRLSNIHRHSWRTSAPRNYLLFRHQNLNRHQMKSPANPRHCVFAGLPLHI